MRALSRKQRLIRQHTYKFAVKEIPILASISENDVSDCGDATQKPEFSTSTSSPRYSPPSLSNLNSSDRGERVSSIEDNVVIDGSIDHPQNHSQCHTNTFVSLCHCGKNEVKKGNYTLAEEFYRKALLEYKNNAEILAEKQFFDCQFALANILRLRRKFDQAEDIYKELLSRARISYGNLHPFVMKCNKFLVDIKMLREKHEEKEADKQLTLELERKAFINAKIQEENTSSTSSPWTTLYAAVSYAGGSFGQYNWSTKQQ
mmetsp:Transcript_203/g.250  ORF Transcript_203/g.250 Transcript_203/m.250 type:complete len:260 (-) Transcript_203:834-1613(-)